MIVENLKGYLYCTLGDVITLKRGYDLPHNHRLQGEIPVVSSSGITGRHNTAKVKAPGVVTGRYGTLGEVFYIEEDFWPLNTALYVCDFKGNHPKFISYMLRTLGLEFQNAAGAVPGINRNVLHKIPITLPPLETQERIAEILSKYDNLIDNNNRRIALLEESIHLLYKDWFVRLRFPGYESVKVVDGVPEGWEVLNLDDVVSEIIDYRGKTPKKLGSDWSNSGITALSALNVKKGRLVSLDKCKYVDQDLYDKWMKSKLKKGDILMTSEAPLGELYYLAEDQTFCLSQRLYSIRANPNIIKPEILFCALSSSQVQGEIHARKSGTTVFGIRQSELRKVPVLVPSIEIQKQASEILNNLFMQKENLNKAIDKLQQARDLLLPRLMNGTITV